VLKVLRVYSMNNSYLRIIEYSVNDLKNILHIYLMIDNNNALDDQLNQFDMLKK